MVCAIGNSAVIDETATGVDNGFAPTGAGYKLFDKSVIACVWIWCASGGRGYGVGALLCILAEKLLFCLEISVMIHL